MSEVNITRWVLALREPGRKQIVGHLETSEGMCCLGVACSIAPLEELNIIRRVITDGNSWFTTFSDRNGTLPDEIANWLGGVTNNPRLQIPTWLRSKARLDDDEYYRHATGLNDSYGFSFAEISDCIVLTYGLEESLGYVTKP